MPSLGSESFDYENMALEGSIYVRSNEKGETFKLNKVRWRAADLALTRGWSYNWKRLRQRTEICGTVEWCDVVFTIYEAR
ncbi:unnamed protein product [Brassica rapa subsp. narinosa]